jgi:phage terminase small subunit
MAARKRARRHKTTPPLTARQIRFCQLYVERGNATQAYLDAGFPHSRRTATELACRLSRSVEIRAYIRDLQHAAADATRATVEELARRFWRAATADVTVIFGREGEVMHPSRWPKEFVSAVTSIEVDERFETRTVKGKRTKVRVGTRWKVKVENKTEARKVLAQWREMIGQDKGADGPDGAPGADGPRVRV